MKCFRVKLSDRKDPPSSANRRGSPRHYCQRRLADTSLDEQEWLKRYTPERYHLDSSDRSESRSSSPDSFKAGREDRPACLTITNLDFPEDILPESNPRSRKRVRYRSIPKNSSAHLHRMFVKSEDEIPCEPSRSSSRASSNYEYEFEEYLRNVTLPESADCSLFGDEEVRKIVEEPTNNNDSDYINHEPTPSPVAPLIKEVKSDKAISSTHRKEKRKSLTLSRIPSPETVQVIRIDVITGYPVSSDNSILSEMTENDTNSVDSCPKESHRNDQTDNNRVLCDIEKIARKRDFLECERLLNCRSVNLSARYYGGKAF